MSKSKSVSERFQITTVRSQIDIFIKLWNLNQHWEHLGVPKLFKSKWFDNLEENIFLLLKFLEESRREEKIFRPKPQQ